MAKTAAVKKVKTAELAPNAFIGKPAPPSASELAAALGKSSLLWERLIRELKSERLIDGQQWHSYSKNAGWSLKLLRGERVILYMSPLDGCFRASFALGERAVQAARTSGLSSATLKLLSEAKKYAEGTAVRIEVHTADDVETVKKMAEAKVEN
jgi:Protein of unknown function (DUF3788)